MERVRPWDDVVSVVASTSSCACSFLFLYSTLSRRPWHLNPKHIAISWLRLHEVLSLRCGCKPAITPTARYETTYALTRHRHISSNRKTEHVKICIKKPHDVPRTRGQSFKFMKHLCEHHVKSKVCLKAA